MSRYKKYPKRSEYQVTIGEGKNLLFERDLNINESAVASVAWFGIAYTMGTYKITHAFPVMKNIAYKYEEYPFIRTKKDKAFVEKRIQSNCDHGWSYYNYHAACWKCGLALAGDYREKVLEIEGVEAIDLNDDYIVEKYGKEGLALRRARVGAKEK